MNFTQEIKRELMRRAPAARDARLALLLGLLSTGGSLDETEFFLSSESEEIAAFGVKLVEELFGARMEVSAIERGFGRNKLTFACGGPPAKKAADELFACAARGFGEEEGRACLTGAFLGGGSCTLPHGGTKTGYHLEIVAEEAASERLLDLLARFQLLGSLLFRGGHAVVYIKSREGISDFLSVLGAENALSTLAEVTSRREESNNINRVENCSAGNADRAAIASAEQVRAIARLREKGVLATLEEPLRETALARIERPLLSLAELAASLGLSKSCLNHRLRRLMELSRQLDQKE